MFKEKHLKPAEPHKQPGTPVPKCFSDKAPRARRSSKVGQFVNKRRSGSVVSKESESRCDPKK